MILAVGPADRHGVVRGTPRRRTVALYRQLLRSHIAPYLGAAPIAALDAAAVRAWRADLLTRGVSQTVTAKAYRLLRAVLNTAVREDELIRVNPCRIPGADREDTAERPVLSVAQVYALADEMPKRFRALILLTTFGCLRWGEVAALRRRDLDASRGPCVCPRRSASARVVGWSSARRSRGPDSARWRSRPPCCRS